MHHHAVASLFACSLLLGVLPLTAQLTVRGTVVEAASQSPVEFATVKVLTADSSLVGGTTTDPDGRFEVQVPSAEASIEISFIGFATFAKTGFGESPVQDLGTISLQLAGELLDDVIVRAERSTTEFRLDRRVFNVGQDLASAGASSLEVLNNVPSVTVSLEGEVALRGSAGVQILIDGKPSVLASEGGQGLGAITAEMIDRVEVITNPSAKYDAEGSSGIINIVLKREDKTGIAGSASLNTGTPANHSFGLSLSQRAEKFSLFGQLGGGIRRLPRFSESANLDETTNTLVLSTGDATREETFVNVILGTDYRINALNTLSLTGFFAYEWEQNPSTTDFRVLQAGGQLEDSWRRTEDTEAGNPKWQYELNYTKRFDPDDKDHQLVVTALGNAFQKDQESTFSTQVSSGEARFGDQQTRTEFGEVAATFKLDYTRPLTKTWTLETGAQYQRNDVSNDFETRDLLGTDFVVVPAQTDVFSWDQGVTAAYATGAYEGERWGVKGGLRAEYTDLQTALASEGQPRDQDYADLFPSVATSYKLSEAASLQASYSRRIFRPRLWNLNPFFNIRDNFNVRTGNPDLQPEYTDAYELTGLWVVGELSLSSAAYYRRTTDVVERVSFVTDNVNVTKPVNIGTTDAVGLEFNGKYTVTRWLTLSTDLNYFTFERAAVLDGRDLSFGADRLTGRLVSKLRLPADFDVEVTGNLRSREITVQGRERGFAWLDAGVRKKVLGGKVVVSAGVRDALASRVQVNTVRTPGFSIRNERFRGRFWTLGVSYAFGKGEAMEFAGRRRW